MARCLAVADAVPESLVVYIMSCTLSPLHIGIVLHLRELRHHWNRKCPLTPAPSHSHAFPSLSLALYFSLSLSPSLCISLSLSLVRPIQVKSKELYCYEKIYIYNAKAINTELLSVKMPTCALCTRTPYCTWPTCTLIGC